MTHELQFRGAEADYVIFVTRSWGGNYSTSRRSPVTRAVAGLMVVTSDWRTNISELRNNWDHMELMEIVGVRVRELRRLWDVEIVEEGVIDVS